MTPPLPVPASRQSCPRIRLSRDWLLTTHPASLTSRDLFRRPSIVAPLVIATGYRVPRRKIRAHIARVVSGGPGSTANLSGTIAQFLTIDNRQSDNVHGAAPRLLELYGGSPPQFHMGGMLRTEQESEHRRYFRNYVYRAICLFSMVTRAFGDSAAGDKILGYADRFEQSRPLWGRKQSRQEALGGFTAVVRRGRGLLDRAA